MAEHTATVEVLTAEVRVLMVGSRQITLSVVRQLDEIDPDLIMPFGRIRASSKPSANAIEVIGSDPCGALARATVRRHGYICYEGRTGNYNFDKYPHRPCPGHPYSRESHEWYVYEPGESLFEEWSDLPLIVLTGLR